MDIAKIIEFLSLEQNWKLFWKLQNSSNLSINQIQSLIFEYSEFPIKDLLSLIKIQKKNLTKNKAAADLVFTEKGAQQASSGVLAAYHGCKFQRYSTVADLCCGNGVDLLQLSAGKQHVFAVDLDEITLQTARFNTRTFNNIEFMNSKAEEFEVKVGAIFVDPDRRSELGRLLDAEMISPPLSKLLQLQTINPNLAIKLSPAMNYHKLKLPSEYTLEFVSEDGVLKEILLCLGNLVTQGIKRKAVLLPAGRELNNNNTSIPIIGIQKFIFEPDPAIIRAGLVQEVGSEIGFDLINKHLALLSGNERVFSEFGTTFSVIDNFPYNMKLLHRYLRQQQIGNLVIKTRGFPITVENFRKKLKLKGKHKTILFIIRLGNSHQMIFANRLVQ